MKWSMFVCGDIPFFWLQTNKQCERDIFGFITPNNSILRNREFGKNIVFLYLLYYCPFDVHYVFFPEDPNICINISNDPISIVSVAIDLSCYSHESWHVIFEIVSTFTQRSFCINICGAVFWFSKTPLLPPYNRLKNREANLFQMKSFSVAKLFMMTFKVNGILASSVKCRKMWNIFSQSQHICKQKINNHENNS